MAFSPGISLVFFFYNINLLVSLMRERLGCALASRVLARLLFIWLINLVFLRRERLGCALASRGHSRLFSIWLIDLVF